MKIYIAPETRAFGTALNGDHRAMLIFMIPTLNFEP